MALEARTFLAQYSICNSIGRDMEHVQPHEIYGIAALQTLYLPLQGIQGGRVLTCNQN